MPIVGALSTVALPACESDATNIEASGGLPVEVLSCVFSPDEDVVAHLASSVPYDSPELFATVGSAEVTLSVNSFQVGSLTLPDGDTSVSFGHIDLSEADTVSLCALIERNGNVLTASAPVMPRVDIIRVDTISSSSGDRLHMVLLMKDSLETNDFYQIEVERQAYSAGLCSDTILRCSYTSNVFNDIGSSTANTIGIFSDDRLSTRNGINVLSFSVPWADVRQPLAQAAQPDSLFLAVRLYHHSEDYYNFLFNALQTHSYLLLPVFGTSSSATNVTGGYGIVACLTSDVWRIRIAQE